jgi:hypothetical protein
VIARTSLASIVTRYTLAVAVPAVAVVAGWICANRNGQQAGIAPAGIDELPTLARVVNGWHKTTDHSRQQPISADSTAAEPDSR